MANKETINAVQIAALAGSRSKNYAHTMLRVDPTFPRPVIEQKSVLSQWFKAEIEAYLAKKAAQPKAPTGRKAVKLQAAQRNTLDLNLTQQFIRSGK